MKNRRSLLYTFHLLLVIVLTMGSVPASLADKTDPELLPPDVTLPVGPSGSAPAPGVSASTTETAPGLTTPGAAALPGKNSGAGAASSPPGSSPLMYGHRQPMPPGTPFPSGPSPTNAQTSPGSAATTNNAATSVPATNQPSFAIPTHLQQQTAASSSASVSPAIDTAPNKTDPIAVLETSKGVITIRLFRHLAPKTVANFMDLVTKGFYNGLTFHRVEQGFVIQGGCPYGTGTGLYIDPASHQPRFIPLEVSPSLRHNAPGVVAMARFGKSPSSASCQFYITLAPAPNLDNQYGIFGGVIRGMDVVNRIAKGDKILSVSLQEQQ
jgi:peptidyl-prolyl cis-trans isomerase B (cyclophilin B)